MHAHFHIASRIGNEKRIIGRYGAAELHWYSDLISNAIPPIAYAAPVNDKRF